MVAAVAAAGPAFAWSCGTARAQIVEEAPVHRIVVTLDKSKTLKKDKRLVAVVDLEVALDTGSLRG